MNILIYKYVVLGLIRVENFLKTCVWKKQTSLIYKFYEECNRVFTAVAMKKYILWDQDGGQNENQ